MNYAEPNLSMWAMQELLDIEALLLKYAATYPDQTEHVMILDYVQSELKRRWGHADDAG